MVRSIHCKHKKVICFSENCVKTRLLKTQNQEQKKAKMELLKEN